MSGFNTKERNNNGEYEITFYTESRQDFEKVQDLCRELIGHSKPVSTEGDLISRSDLKNKFISTISVGRLEFGDIINLIDNASPVEPQNEWGKWIVTEVWCPKCHEYCDPATYPTEELNKCPNCGAAMRKGGKEE